MNFSGYTNYRKRFIKKCYLQILKFNRFSLRNKIIILYSTSVLFLMIFSLIIASNFITNTYQKLVIEKLNSDMLYLEKLINDDGEWTTDGRYLYKGTKNFGDGISEHAWLSPFLILQYKTGTLSYIFIRCIDDYETSVKYINNTKYYEGHYICIAGSIKNANNKNIISAHIDKKVADKLDKNNEYYGKANVDGIETFCIYRTIVNKDNKIIGAIVVGKYMKDYNEEINHILLTMCTIIIIMFGVVILIIMYISNIQTASILKICHYIDNLNDGLPDKPLNILAGKEMQLMANAINKLVKAIKENNLLKYISETDELTKAHNRYWFNNNIQQILRSCRKYKLLFGFEIFDIDNFKAYNDNYGHTQGDLLLQLLTVIIKDTIKPYNNNKQSVELIRLGGDEFVIIFIGLNINQIKTLAKEISNNIHKANIPHIKNKYKIVTISQGIAVNVTNKKMNIEFYYKKADEALYNIKETSKNDFKIITI